MENLQRLKEHVVRPGDRLVNVFPKHLAEIQQVCCVVEPVWATVKKNAFDCAWIVPNTPSQSSTRRVGVCVPSVTWGIGLCVPLLACYLKALNCDQYKRMAGSVTEQSLESCLA